MSYPTTIERLDGSRARARYVRHVRTLTGTTSFGRNDDVDLYRLKDGTMIECISPSNDCRVAPVECDPTLGHYPGHRPGE